MFLIVTIVEFHFSITWLKGRRWLILHYFCLLLAYSKMILFSFLHRNLITINLMSSNIHTLRPCKHLDLNRKHLPLLSHVHWLPKSLILDSDWYLLLKFSQSSHKQEDCGNWSFQASSLCLFKNSYSWQKLRSSWNVSGKEAYCWLAITFDALTISSKSQFFHRRYLFCLYWRLLRSIPT